jgi:hypothetical protein
MSMGTTRAAAVITLLYAARRYYRNWGTTKDECRSWLPGDELVHAPFTRSTEGVWIDAPPSAVWPWLTAALRAGSDLAVGDAVPMGPKNLGWLRQPTMKVEQVAAGETVVLRGTPPDFPWDAVWSFHLQPRREDRCRLLLRMRAQLRRPGEILKVESTGPAIALTMRATLRAVKHKAESPAQSTRLQGAS